MIVGTGLVAKAFGKYANEMGNVCIFASGVANSKCNEENEFARERTLLQDVIESLSADCHLAYFSTCSIYDSTLKDSAYVSHKLNMEALICKRRYSHVFRLPQLAGYSQNNTTLLNYLNSCIDADSLIKISRNAERNIIDVEDVARAVNHLLDNSSVENLTVNICNLRRERVLEIVSTLERIKGKRAKIELVEGGSFYDIPIGAVEEIYKEIGLHFSESYLEGVLRKYYLR
ncbi:NAD(P)-dependent oxidoreductase [Diaphorobacter aerolatus]|uniref:NAD(P)-dependent oxidoreductase n=1 Tax=Diaphorobacter aerolatus TaxID=1288495 RepID=A0A7H0GNK8_9BURK|nr:NAD(P)-dependent oxidoreductase [Diaphorobacter aerolatus]QNP49874.1 NAD(P)-dependent oxidoreductase [Diaphorobacter aerolatus]